MHHPEPTAAAHRLAAAHTAERHAQAALLHARAEARRRLAELRPGT
ncbi:hypothetical protein [Embleya sp. NPDC059237]